jgi:integrase/recombinase XerD
VPNNAEPPFRDSVTAYIVSKLLLDRSCRLGIIPVVSKWLVIRPDISETIISERYCPNPAVLEKVRTGPLGAHIDAVVGELSDRGYAKSTSSYALRLIAALGTWLEQSALTGADLDEGTVDTFLTCRYRGRRPHRGDRAILAFFLAFLRRTGVLAGAEAPPVADPIAPLREAFRQHLIGQRDLAPTTLRRHVDMAARFLDWRFGAQLPPSLSVLCADDINRFMLEQARRYCAPLCSSRT